MVSPTMNRRLHIDTYLMLLCWCFCTFAMDAGAQTQTSGIETRFSNHRWLVGLTSQSLYDGYLSSVPYDGSGLCFNLTTLGPSSTGKWPLMLYQQLEGLVAVASNEASTASLSRINLLYRLGTLYAFKPVYGVKAALGPLFGAGFGMKQLPRNVNNPYNMDLSVDVLLGATLTYDIPIGQRPWRLKADLKSPLVGCFFAPVRGQSYYEWLTYNQYDEVFHVSSLHNKNALSMLYTLDIPLKSVVLSIGFSGQMAAYETADMVFKEQGWGIMAGCSLDMAVFSGFPLPTKPGHVRVDR